MTVYFCPKKKLFYDAAVALEIPDGSKEVSESVRQEIIAAQFAGLQIGADADGNPIAVAPPQLSLEEEKRVYSTAIQAHLDAVAVAHGYDDIKTAVTYADEPSVPKFQADGKAFRAWRSIVWEYAYAQLDLVQSDMRPKPSIEQLIAELPGLTGL